MTNTTQTDLLDGVEPDGYVRYAETYPTNEKYFMRFSKTTDGWADRLYEPLYSRKTVEALLEANRKQVLLEAAEEFSKNQYYMQHGIPVSELRRMALEPTGVDKGELK